MRKILALAEIFKQGAFNTWCISSSFDGLVSSTSKYTRHYSQSYNTNRSVEASATHNIQSIVGRWTDKFTEKKISEPLVSAQLIVAHVLGFKTLSGIAPWQILSNEKTEKINQLCALRLKRMPVQYIIEEWDFRDLILQMKPPVFIPRPETEELITHITNYIRVHELPSPQRILDIGCGTGAVALALAKEYPSAHCLALDKCPVACELTMKNANNYALSNVHVENVEFSHQSVKVEEIFKTAYDLVVSNPPYVKTGELNSIAPDIQLFEDVAGSLDGGEDGLKVVLSILQNSHKFMHSKSSLWIEVDSSHPDIIKDLAEKNTDWKLEYVKTYKDFLEKPRFCHLKSR